MFGGCSSLEELPDISKWDISNIKNISGLFDRCEKLKNIPDISMKDLFYSCSSLEKIPDISQWNISNTKDISYIFYNCASLTSLPDISIWDTKNVEYAYNIIVGCKLIIDIPAFSEWNLNKIKDNNFNITDDEYDSDLSFSGKNTSYNFSKGYDNNTNIIPQLKNNIYYSDNNDEFNKEEYYEHFYD